MIENPRLVFDSSGSGAGTQFNLSAPLEYPYREIQAVLSGSGSVAVDVILQQTLNNDDWSDRATIALTGTDGDSGMATFISNGGNYRINAENTSGSISGIKVWVA